MTVSESANVGGEAIGVAPEGRRRRVKVVEKFGGHRVHQRSGPWRRVRAAVALILLAAVTATLVATVVALLIGSIVLAIQHSLTSSP